MCSNCAGDYENPELTAEADERSDGSVSTAEIYERAGLPLPERESE